MLIAHISDTHLGAISSIQERENDFYNSFKQAIDIIIKEHAKIVIHSGDIFDNPRPIGTALKVFLDCLKRLEEHGIRFLFILGEHDISRLRSFPTALIYNELNLAKHVNGKVVIDDVAFVGFHKYRFHEINRLKERLASITIDAKKKVLMLHQGLKEFHEYAGELSHYDLPRDYDYYAFGHLHDHCYDRFDGFKGMVCYSGSTEVTSEEPISNDISKGFCFVDLSSQEPKPEFIKLDIRKHVVLDLINNPNPIDMIKSYDKPIVKVRLKEEQKDILKTIEKYALYIIPELVDVNYVISKGSRSKSIEEEMFERAKDILADEDKARFAIKELLPLLNNDSKEALELLWDCYKRKRFG